MRHYYDPTRWRPWALRSLIFRTLAGLLSRWPLFLIAALLISPVGPHLRIQYTYREVYGHRVMLTCDYLGSRGVIRDFPGGDCPILAIIDTRREN